MQFRRIFFPSLLSLSAALATLPAQAAPIKLQVFQSIDAQANNRTCPTTVTVMQQSQPYREGSYTIEGSAKLGWLADNFTLAASDAFSATWVAKLKPQYSKCKATAGMTQQGSDRYQGHSYLRLRFVEGKVYLVLDMTGMSDANGLTPAITRKGVQQGNPVWSWAGTD